MPCIALLCFALLRQLLGATWLRVPGKPPVSPRSFVSWARNQFRSSFTLIWTGNWISNQAETQSDLHFLVELMTKMSVSIQSYQIECAAPEFAAGNPRLEESFPEVHAAASLLFHVLQQRRKCTSKIFFRNPIPACAVRPIRSASLWQR